LTLGYTALVRGDLVNAAVQFAKAEPVLESLSLLVDLRRVLNGLGICHTGLGNTEKAIDAFTRAAEVAQRCGSAGASLANLASLYQDLGMFERACRCYRRAIDDTNPWDTRVYAEVHANLAWLALELGNLSEARYFTQMCADWARKSGLTRHAVLSLIVRADLHLAQTQHELAWPLVEEAIALTTQRHNDLFDRGAYVRLAKYFVWATQGYDSVMAWWGNGGIEQCVRIADKLEVAAFDEWLAAKAGSATPAAGTVVKAVTRHGLVGVIARLVAVGVAPPGLPRPLAGESSAQLMARVFPHPERERVPNSVELPTQGDAPPGFS
jgi:hypothetical protein